MITAEEPVFPNNVVSLCKTRFGTIDTDIEVLRRPLRNTDPQQSIGIFAQQWLGNDRSKEIMGGFQEPTLQTYRTGIQAFVRDGDEERGLAIHSVLASRIRSMLYRDTPLQVGLSSLSATDPATGVKESARRWGIGPQRFYSNEIGGEWLYLATLEFWLETEIG